MQTTASTASTIDQSEDLTQSLFQIESLLAMTYGEAGEAMLTLPDENVLGILCAIAEKAKECRIQSESLTKSLLKNFSLDSENINQTNGVSE